MWTEGRNGGEQSRVYSHYGIVPRMMVSPPERDLSIDLFGKHLPSPIFMCPIGLIGLVRARLSGRRGGRAGVGGHRGAVHVVDVLAGPDGRRHQHAGDTPTFYQLYLPDDRELAASLINRAETQRLFRPGGHRGLAGPWASGHGSETGNFPQFRGYCMQNYYSDKNFTKHLAKPPEEDQAAALAHYTKIFANPLSWEDLRWIRTQTKLPSPSRGFSIPTTRAWQLRTVPTCSIALITVAVRQIRESPHCSCCPAWSKPPAPPRCMFDSGVRYATDAIIALALGATAVGIGRPYAYALSYGGAESLIHYLRSFLPNSICAWRSAVSRTSPP